ncbi:acetyl-CoA carboxylase carboxyl transferase subunit alpha [Corallococcus sp. H22C18031201]|uniref:acetyl-CoA carboxylase carboxyltransferase subunit alpha n=1 Tax=Citreicoccus inhibens TaxID=2849499 RepID=UPI000E70E0C1|nr:acetyl-CoA carboxylase carboxyltransferase subunit alpha [Citreicoccus inhibens]MBU8894539.1 acetyl-CoA carboxylase carboxyltransferase subunit alpha [Citreicoccus inhibens]RJS25136.1 acetyl-CoA carboxylase carboxyl transferase subunit alpha [Corallococcus sp. H22C18031201]
MATGTGYALDFERPLIELEKKIDELKALSTSGSVDFSSEISKLEKKAKKLQTEIFSDLSRWQVVQLARHSARPFFLDYVQHLFTDYFELSGDRRFGEDTSLIGGFARFDGKPVMVLGHQKGRTTKENMSRNFGMPRPEGYRKALRLMELAERFEKPIFTFVDTMGAYPGIGAEERGQAEAIAVNLEVMSRLKVPIISTVLGEGGSGGALAIGVGNRVLMMQNSIYSVISPEGCASILFRDASKASKAADALKLTAKDLLEMKVIDEVIQEPAGGAHRDPPKAAEALGKALRKHLGQLSGMSPDELVRDRYNKFRAFGVFSGR